MRRMAGNRSWMPWYSGVTMHASWPARASALPSAPTMSPSPPVLEYGWTSLLARRIFINRGRKSAPVNRMTND